MNFFFMILFPLISLILVYNLSLSFPISSFLFYAVPSIYLSIKKPKIIKKSLIFTIIIVGTISWMLCYMAFLDGSWYSDYSARRLLDGSIPIEDIFFGFWWVYFGVVFWEFFLDHHKKIIIPQKVKYLIVLLSMALVAFLVLYVSNSKYLNQPFFYLKSGLVLVVLPLLFVLIKYPRMLRKLLIIGLYFFCITFVFEWLGLKLNHWWFPGKNFFAIATLADKSLPWEEILFFFVLGIPGLVCWYEIFADDRK